MDHAAVLSAFPDGPLDVAIDGAGDAIAVFGETHVSGVTSTFTLYDSKRPASGTWGPAAVLSVPGDAGYRPRAVADAAGTFIVAWSDLTAGTLNLLTSPPRGSFGPATIFTAGTLGDIKIAPGHAVVTFGTDVSTEPVSWGLSS